MKTQELKNSILKLAMEGKLISQITSDEPARILYKKIKDEKKRLIDNKSIKREKDSSPIKAEEIPFEIPKSWKWVRLGDIGRWGAGSTPSRSNPLYYNGNIPWLKTGELNDGIIHQSNEHITESALKETSVKLNPIGSVLIAMYGATIGKLGILSFEATTNQACCVCVPYKGIYNKFLFYYLMSERNTFINAAEGGAQPNISRTKIINFPFPLPPFIEQQRIVEKIEELLQKVDQYDQLKQKITSLNNEFPANMEKSILQYAMEGKLVPQVPSEGSAQQLLDKLVKEKKDLILNKSIPKQLEPLPISKDEIYFDIPHSWEWVRLNQIGGIVSGGTPKSSESTYWDSEGVIWITPKDMGENKNMFISNSARKISSLGLEKSSAKLIPKGSIAFSSRAPIGYIKIVEENYATNQGCKSVVPLIYNKYIFYALKFFTPEIIKNASGTTFKEISGSKFAQTLLPLPPEDEQYRIVEKIEEILIQIYKLNSF